MTFKTTLFKALHAADFSHCNGQAVEARSLDDGPGALLRPYVDLADGSTIEIENQEIQVDDQGRAYCRAKRGGDDGEPLVWSFRVMSPLRQADLPQESLTVDDLRKVLGASADAGGGGGFKRRPDMRRF